MCRFKLEESYFSYTCHDRFSERTAMMTPAALSAGDHMPHAVSNLITS
jgi:hypothetical protein